MRHLRTGPFGKQGGLPEGVCAWKVTMESDMVFFPFALRHTENQWSKRKRGKTLGASKRRQGKWEGG